MKRTFKKGDLLLVKWDDICSADRSWCTDEDLTEMQQEGYPCTTVGFLYAVNKKSLLIHSTQGPGKKSGIWCIPLGAIKDIKRIRAPK